MPVDGRSPCIIGAARLQVGRTDGPAGEPLDLWEQACLAAAADTGAANVLASVGQLDVVRPSSWTYDDGARRLGARLRITPAVTGVHGISGSTPQKLVNRAAEAIVGGHVDVVMIVGGEPKYTVRRMRLDGRSPQWSHPSRGTPSDEWEASLHPSEVLHGGKPIIRTMAMRDVARRAHLGIPPKEYAEALGPTYSHMTRVAAANPYAWNRTERTAEEIVTPSAVNFLVESFYTKYMVACPDVDQAGALVLASHSAADALGVPRDRRVYVRGWSQASDPPFVASNPELWHSPAMEAAASQLFADAGLGIDDVRYIDLYTCFPVAVSFNRDALGLPAGDERGVTVTGGLPYAGAAASSYVVLSIAAMVDRLRSDAGSVGLVNGLGMQLAQHAYGLYSTTPGTVRPPSTAALQARLDGAPTFDIREGVTGRGTLAAYSVAFERDGSPRDAFAVCDVAGDGRCYAMVTEPDSLTELARTEHVGSVVHLETPGPGEPTIARLES